MLGAKGGAGAVRREDAHVEEDVLGAARRASRGRSAERFGPHRGQQQLRASAWMVSSGTLADLGPRLRELSEVAAPPLPNLRDAERRQAGPKL